MIRWSQWFTSDNRPAMPSAFLLTNDFAGHLLLLSRCWCSRFEIYEQKWTRNSREPSSLRSSVRKKIMVFSKLICTPFFIAMDKTLTKLDAVFERLGSCSIIFLYLISSTHSIVIIHHRASRWIYCLTRVDYSTSWSQVPVVIIVIIHVGIINGHEKNQQKVLHESLTVLTPSHRMIQRNSSCEKRV